MLPVPANPNPRDVFRRLRDEAPLYFNEQYGFYALSRFKDVLEASFDDETREHSFGSTPWLESGSMPSEPGQSSPSEHSEEPESGAIPYFSSL